MASTIPINNFDVYAGDPCDIELGFEDSLGAPILTITKATMTLKDPTGFTDPLVKVATLNVSLGEMTFSFTSAETAALIIQNGVSLEEKVYRHDVQIELSSGLSPITLIRGKVTVTGDITV